MCTCALRASERASDCSETHNNIKMRIKITLIHVIWCMCARERTEHVVVRVFTMHIVRFHRRTYMFMSCNIITVRLLSTTLCFLDSRIQSLVSQCCYLLLRILFVGCVVLLKCSDPNSSLFKCKASAEMWEQLCKAKSLISLCLRSHSFRLAGSIFLLFRRLGFSFQLHASVI